MKNCLIKQKHLLAIATGIVIGVLMASPISAQTSTKITTPSVSTNAVKSISKGVERNIDMERNKEKQPTDAKLSHGKSKKSKSVQK